MAEHPNVARIRRSYAIRGTSTEFSDSDKAELEDLIDENLVHHGQGTSRFARDLKGRDEFFALERQFAQMGTTQHVREIFADDVHAIAIVEIHVQHEDKQASWTEAEIFHFDSNGKVTDSWAIPMDQQVVDDFWAGVMGSRA